MLTNVLNHIRGAADMMNEVLKQGALIVDGLSSYKQPVFIYLPPRAELRGGAWVVVDKTINENGMMEMYADPTSRGGVLEPEGIVSVKYRQDKQRETMARLDPAYAQLQKDGDRKALQEREKAIAPVFSSVAVAYADLHDKTGRMSAVGAIREAVPWSNARRYFYTRLNRRLLEQSYVKDITTAMPEFSTTQALELIESVIGVGLDDAEDASISQLLTDKKQQLHKAIAAEQQKVNLVKIKAMASTLDEDTRRQLLASLQ
jgi:acetyl-CoA carboxylase/biotin carboxylase 1